MASVLDHMFEAVLTDMEARGKRLNTMVIVDELKRRTGQARTYVERCSHCGGELRTRQR